MAGRARTDAAGLTTPSAAATPRPPWSGDDRARTGGLSPDKRALCSPELRPLDPFESRGWDSNPRSRAHEAREDSRSSTAQVWPAGSKAGCDGLAVARPVPCDTRRSRVSRTCGLRRPKPAGWPTPPQPDGRSAPPAGFEPAASGLRARRHRPFDHGGTGEAELRRQGSNLPLASNRRASCRLDHAGTKRKERESNPQGPGRPTRFRDGIPRRWQSFRSGPGRRRTCNPPLKRRELCLLSYGARE